MKISRRKAMALGAGAAATAAGVVGSPSPAAAQVDRAATLSDQELATTLPHFRSRHAQVNGVRLHYVTGGHGEPLVLVHGWPETWWEWRKVMPALAQHYRVIAVDMRGIGGSSKPASGYDKKNMALDIKELATRLGYSEINIAGHDIGAQVAFSFAMNHPETTRKVAILSVTHPDESYYQSPLLLPPDAPGFNLWWHAFNQVQGLPEQLVSGRAWHLVNWIYDTFLVDGTAISGLDRAIYAHAYNRADAIRASNGWYQAWHQDIVDQQAHGLVTAPMLGMASPGFFDIMSQVLPGQGTDVALQLVEGAGHYFIEERPELVVDAFTSFFG